MNKGSIITLTLAVLATFVFFTHDVNTPNTVAASNNEIANIISTEIIETTNKSITSKYVKTATSTTKKRSVLSTTTSTTTSTTSTTSTTTTTTTTTTTEPETTFVYETDAPRSYEHFDNYLWVGHSRIVGLANSVGIEYYGQVGSGISYLNSIRDSLLQYSGYNIIFNAGINDYGNINSYINFFNSLPDEFLVNNRIFVMSENPVDEAKERSYGYSVTNSTIEWFNENLKNNLRDDIYFINTYGYLMNNGYDTADGIHYRSNTYIDIYNYMINTINY